jgi:sarcosine oxidase
MATGYPEGPAVTLASVSGPSAIVVGAGVFGASLADRLALEGWSVTLVDRASPGNERAASGALSRCLRFSHGPDPLYTRLSRRARELWLELDSGLLVECGVAWLVRQPGEWEADSERVLREEGVPVQRLGGAEAAGLLPGLARWG